MSDNESRPISTGGRFFGIPPLPVLLLTWRDDERDKDWGVNEGVGFRDEDSNGNEDPINTWFCLKRCAKGDSDINLDWDGDGEEDVDEDVDGDGDDDGDGDGDGDGDEHGEGDGEGDGDRGWKWNKDGFSCANWKEDWTLPVRTSLELKKTIEKNAYISAFFSII
jgi:hypothetical protein